MIACIRTPWEQTMNDKYKFYYWKIEKKYERTISISICINSDGTKAMTGMVDWKINAHQIKESKEEKKKKQKRKSKNMQSLNSMYKMTELNNDTKRQLFGKEKKNKKRNQEWQEQWWTRIAYHTHTHTHRVYQMCIWQNKRWKILITSSNMVFFFRVREFLLCFHRIFWVCVCVCPRWCDAGCVYIHESDFRQNSFPFYLMSLNWLNNTMTNVTTSLHLINELVIVAFQKRKKKNAILSILMHSSVCFFLIVGFHILWKFHLNILWHRKSTNQYRLRVYWCKNII